MSLLKRLHLCSAVLVAVLVCVNAVCGQPICGSWQADEGVTLDHGATLCMTTWDPDGAGLLEERLVVGGSMSMPAPGLTAAPSVAVWDGFAWQPVLAGPSVRALTTFQGQLIAGGNFRVSSGAVAEGVIAYDGTTWRQLGDNLSGTVQRLIVYNNQLVALGRLRRTGQTGFEAAVVLNGGTWQSLGPPMPVSGTSDQARIATIFEGELYVGGSNIGPAGTPSRHLARWDGTTWRDVAGGTDSSVFAMATYNNRLIVGGSFSSVGPSGQAIPVASVAAWDGQVWTSLNSPLAPLSGNTVPVVSALGVLGDRLFVGGLIALDDPQGVVAFDGTAWSTLAGGVSHVTTISVLMPWQGGMLVGGWFGRAGGSLAECAAYFNGERWLTFNEAIRITDISSLNGTIVASGDFVDRPSWNLFSIAQRVGGRWVPVPQAPPLESTTLLTFQGKLIASGMLNHGMGPSAIYAWDGATWTLIGTPDDPVLALAVWNNELCIAGRFTEVDGVSASKLAAWNGLSWRAIPGSPNSDVYALASHSGLLYAGGAFSRIGARAIARVAQFDGAQWSPLGTGITGEVYTFTSLGDDLIIGGEFSQAGGAPACNIVRWSNAQFIPMGSGANAGVLSLATQGSRVFAGGVFSTMDGVTVGRVAIWDGAWRSASGVSDNLGFGVVSSVRLLGDQVHIVGDFWRASQGTANHWARWSDTPFPPVFNYVTPSATLRSGQSAQLEYSASTLSELTITWRRNGTPIQDGPAGASPGGGTVAGASTSSRLSISNVRLSDAGVYDVVLTNACGTTVSPAIPLTVICDANFDGNTVLTSQDVFDFLTAWFANDSRADFNQSGSVSVQDVFSFLTAWFTGC